MIDRLTCDTPGCINSIPNRIKGKKYTFCLQCRQNHTYTTLTVQADHGKSIKEVLLDAALFKSADGMAAYIGVTFPTVYKWIKNYFNLSFQEFKRRYICKSTACYVLNIERSTYSRNDYILKKIRSKRYCACVNIMDRSCIMTNAPITVMSSILRGCPKIEKISDNLFTLAPSPIRFATYPTPLRFKFYKEITRPDINPVRFNF